MAAAQAHTVTVCSSCRFLARGFLRRELPFLLLLLVVVVVLLLGLLLLLLVVVLVLGQATHVLPLLLPSVPVRKSAAATYQERCACAP